MAAPNIANVTTIIGKTTYLSLADTSATVLLNNAASSGKVFKVNTIIVANDDGTNNASITLSINDQDDGGGTAYKIAHTITVPADASLQVLNSPIYLEEDKSLVATASAGGDLDVICSYEDITDD